MTTLYLAEGVLPDRLFGPLTFADRASRALYLHDLLLSAAPAAAASLRANLVYLAWAGRLPADPVATLAGLVETALDNVCEEARDGSRLRLASYASETAVGVRHQPTAAAELVARLLASGEARQAA